MTAKPMQTVLDALDRQGRQHKGTADRVQAQCPAHDDLAPSLSVTYNRATGKVLLNCHAGCSPAAVKDALKLTWRQLSDARENTESTRKRAIKPEIVKVYAYTDEQGEVLFQKLRYHPKTFKIRRPDGRGGWVWGLGETRRVLYNLHLVAAAVAAGKTVAITEGEKDADRVVDELGIAATCNFEGAAVEGQRPKWRDEYSEHLRGADVLIVADNDAAGIAHARVVEQSLRAVTANLRLFLPAIDEPKADISDHFDAGHGLKDLRPLNAVRAATNDEPNESNEVTKKTPTLHQSAYHGALGDVVRALEPATEASPAAMLVQLIACVGSHLGDQVATMVGGSLHPARIWPLIIGPTSSGRKGESRAQVQRFVSSFSSFDSYFVDQESGLSTGEGLLKRLSDEASGTGKTMIVWETEFGRPLAASRRDGNTLSHVLRDLWDDGKGASMTKADPVAVTGAHLTVIGHITPRELRIKLTEIDISGGLANRFLTFWACRTKLLAEQVQLPDTDDLALRVVGAIKHSKGLGKRRILRAESAADYWRRIYVTLAEQEVDGPLGELLARAPAYVLRVALVYAVMDCKNEIGVVHLRAGLAMVAYAIDTATYVFGDTSGSGDLGKLSQALRVAGKSGMARTDISKLFNRNKSAAQIDAMITELIDSGEVRETKIETGARGRPEVRAVWVKKHDVHPLGHLLDEPVLTDDESNEESHADWATDRHADGPSCRWCRKAMPPGTEPEVIGHLECRPARAA